MSKLIQINSKDRISPNTTTASDFSVNLGADHRITSVKAVSVKEVQFVNSFYNINQSNNKLYYTQGGIEDFIEVSPGQYNLEQITTALISSFGGKSITFSLTQNDLTTKLSFTTDVAVGFNKALLNGSKNPMSRALGISNTVTIENSSYTCDSLPDLSGVKSVYVISKQLSSASFISSGRLGSVLDVVPVNVEFGSVVLHSGEGNTDNHVYSTELHNNLSVIDIELRDEDNNLLDTNGHEIVIILKIYT